VRRGAPRIHLLEASRTAEQLMAAGPNFTISARLKTQFIRRDTARVEADIGSRSQCVGLVEHPLLAYFLTS
jgi:hypothetical protein